MYQKVVPLINYFNINVNVFKRYSTNKKDSVWTFMSQILLNYCDMKNLKGLMATKC